jgi:hypothetical protein
VNTTERNTTGTNGTTTESVDSNTIKTNTNSSNTTGSIVNATNPGSPNATDTSSTGIDSTDFNATTGTANDTETFLGANTREINATQMNRTVPSPIALNTSRFFYPNASGDPTIETLSQADIGPISAHELPNPYSSPNMHPKLMTAPANNDIYVEAELDKDEAPYVNQNIRISPIRDMPLEQSEAVQSNSTSVTSATVNSGVKGSIENGPESFHLNYGNVASESKTTPVTSNDKPAVTMLNTVDAMSEKVNPLPRIPPVIPVPASAFASSNLSSLSKQSTGESTSAFFLAPGNHTGVGDPTALLKASKRTNDSAVAIDAKTESSVSGVIDDNASINSTKKLSSSAALLPRFVSNSANEVQEPKWQPKTTNISSTVASADSSNIKSPVHAHSNSFGDSIQQASEQIDDAEVPSYILRAFEATTSGPGEYPLGTDPKQGTSSSDGQGLESDSLP